MVKFFKTAVILDIVRLFPDFVQQIKWGFGNREKDAEAYLEAGIPSSHIFLIGKSFQGSMENFNGI